MVPPDCSKISEIVSPAPEEYPVTVKEEVKALHENADPLTGDERVMWVVSPEQTSWFVGSATASGTGKTVTKNSESGPEQPLASGLTV